MRTEQTFLLNKQILKKEFLGLGHPIKGPLAALAHPHFFQIKPDEPNPVASGRTRFVAAKAVIPKR